MEKSNEILNELASVSPTLATIDKRNVFRIPEGYFEHLPQKISTYVFLNEYPKAQVGDVPNNYFDELSNNIILKIKNADTAAVSAEDETKSMSPLLHSLKDKQVFNVPEGYFHTLNEQVFTKIKPKSAKVVSLYSGKKWLRYAAAAMIAILVGIGALQLFNSKNSQNKISTQLAKNYSENMLVYMQDAIKYKTPEQLNKGLASLTDDEIVTYLVRHGNIMDDYLLTKDIDTKGLPDATEYLIDENTLNNFLNQIDAQASNEKSE